MAVTNSRKLFVNLAVRDLKRTVDFFTRLGFSFNPQFTDEKATCMIVSEEAFFMLMTEDRFKDFTAREICDTRTHLEGLFALSASSRAEVDRLVDTAIEHGGRAIGEPKDHGFMYYRAFYDLDGHHWEVVFMEPSHVQS
ncbi:VOC family protein [Nannocystis sp. ILAH1]|uniref:VOC family protein n=1 Tax=unclassified Nannocystis TaxID=2627009 RepID=UPI002271FFF0|nr:MULTISPECIES: VOC family protein [unclassified Nannocystis]MCY0986728.1 VOC family protein [Nannocystis sp. ILAH1]MCY1071607.1 VOC family protein [Nannocystis sp. RBIL2]